MTLYWPVLARKVNRSGVGYKHSSSVPTTVVKVERIGIKLCFHDRFNHYLSTGKPLSWVAGTACLQERRTSDRKVASSNPGRSGGKIFVSRVNFVC